MNAHMQNKAHDVHEDDDEKEKWIGISLISFLMKSCVRDKVATFDIHLRDEMRWDEGISINWRGGKRAWVMWVDRLKLI